MVIGAGLGWITIAALTLKREPPCGIIALRMPQGRSCLTMARTPPPYSFRNVREAAGLAFSRFKYGLNAGFIGTLPMLLGTGFLANFNLTINPSAILIGCLLAAVGEETLYRGLLFVQLFRYAQWGFVFAGLASALFFGAGHLYQGDSWHYRFNPHSNGYRSGRV